MLIISFALTFFGEIESVMSPRRYVQQLEVPKFMLRQDSKKDNKKTDIEVAIGNCYTTK